MQCNQCSIINWHGQQGFPVGFCAAEGNKSDRDWGGGGGEMWGRGGVASFRGVDSVPLKGPQEIRDTFIIRS